MASTNGAELARDIRKETENFRAACEGLDEAAAARAPQGRWSPKEIISHLCGPEMGDMAAFLRRILNEDEPTLALRPEETHFNGGRARMSVPELVTLFAERAGQLADFAEPLTPDQLDRKAHIPMLEGTPFTDRPTLERLLRLFGVDHVRFHADHLREVRAELDKG